MDVVGMIQVKSYRVGGHFNGKDKHVYAPKY